MAKKITIQLELGGAEKTVSTIEELESALETMKEKVRGVAIGSDAFKHLTSEIQAAESELANLNKRMEGVDTGKLAGSFAKLGEGVAGGFAVATNALAIFGVQNSELAKAQQKAQAAIAVVLGMRAIAEAVVEGRVAARLILEKASAITTRINIALLGAQKVATISQAAATEGATIAQKALNLAMKANPAILILTAIIALIAALASFFSSSEDAKEANEALNKSFEAQGKEIEHNNNMQNEASEQAIRLAKIHGESADQILAKELALSEQRQSQFEEEIQRNNDQIAAKQALLEDMSDDDKKAAEDEITALQDKNTALTENIQKSMDDRIAMQEEYNQKVIDANKKLAQTVEDLEVNAIKNSTERANAKAKLDAQRKIDEINKTEADETSKQKAINAINDATNQTIADNNKAAWEKNTADKLKALKTENELTIEKTKEGTTARLNAQVEALRKENEFYEKNYKGLGMTLNERNLIIEQNNNKALALQKDYATKLKAYLDGIKKAEDDENAAKLKRFKELTKANNDFLTQITQTEAQNRKTARDAEQKEKLASLQAAFDMEYEYRKKNGQDTTALEAQFAQQQAEINKYYAGQASQDSIQIAEAEFEAKKALQAAYIGTVEEFGTTIQDLAGNNEAIANVGLVIEKAAGIASIIVNLQKEVGANRAAAAAQAAVVPDPTGATQAAIFARAAVYNNIARVRAGLGIASIIGTTIAKFKNGGGGAGAGSEGGAGGGGAAAGGAGRLAAPQTAQQNQPTTLFNQSLLNGPTQTGSNNTTSNNPNQRPARVQVLASDITHVINQVEVIESQSRF